MNTILLVISLFGGDDLPTVYDICGEPCPVRTPDYRLPTTSPVTAVWIPQTGSAFYLRGECARRNAAVKTSIEMVWRTSLT